MELPQVGWKSGLWGAETIIVIGRALCAPHCKNTISTGKHQSHAWNCNLVVRNFVLLVIALRAPQFARRLVRRAGKPFLFLYCKQPTRFAVPKNLSLLVQTKQHTFESVRAACALFSRMRYLIESKSFWILREYETLWHAAVCKIGLREKSDVRNKAFCFAKQKSCEQKTAAAGQPICFTKGHRKILLQPGKQCLKQEQNRERRKSGSQGKLPFLLPVSVNTTNQITIFDFFMQFLLI